jgi:hypothetical protein
MSTNVVGIKKILAAQYAPILGILSFSIPLFLSSPQIITGTLVNCFLFLAAERLSKKEMIPFVILPSLGAISHGILFGPQTIFLYYFLPFIWIGNYVLVRAFSLFSSLPYVIKISISAVLKYLVLQSFAQIYFNLKIVPSLFVASMGYMQLMTALMGGLLAFGITTYLDHERTKNSH